LAPHSALIPAALTQVAFQAGLQGFPSFPEASCLWFGWDRVNFPRKLGGDAALMADLNQPNGMFDSSIHNWESWLVKRNRCSGIDALGIGPCTTYPLLCVLFLSVLLLLFSSSFAVLLNCPYPNP